MFLTGRFACELGGAEGIGTSSEMLKFAEMRRIKTYLGSAASLPFPDGSFDGVLSVLSLCFFADAAKALDECHRVLMPSGTLLLGIIPGDSAWGKYYLKKKAERHPVYIHADFLPYADVVALIERDGVSLIAGSSTLFQSPEHSPEPNLRVADGIVSGASFSACSLIDCEAVVVSH